ncbi:MAG: hypothetical protein FDW93_06530 [Bergeyella sp.]|nr:hypothetical protein [Bergeyella sp.]
MLLEKIISISGKPGLYKLVSRLKNGFIVEEVITKKRLSIGNSSQVSLLDNISMYTQEKEVPLFDIFETIAKNYNHEEAIHHKSPDAELRDFMAKSLPGYDSTRVYISDMRKLAQWYNILQKAGYITPESFSSSEDEKEFPQKREAVNKESMGKQASSKKVVPKVTKGVTKVKSSAASGSRKGTRSKKG